MATVVNSTVSGNTTAARGAGIYTEGAAGETTAVTIANSTVAANTGAGANLWSDDDTLGIRLRSTIVSDPLGDEGNCSSGGGGVITSQGYNHSDDDSCDLTATADQPSTDPDLGPLASNGGPTRTMALPLTSPAVDKGFGGSLTTDQRGLTRPVDFPAFPNAPGGGGTDIGAFEVQMPPAPPEPSNEFSFGKVKKNKRKGTAKLSVIIPGPGGLELAKTNKVKADEATADAEGEETLAIKAKGKAKRRLRTKGKAKVNAEVTYMPDGGEPLTKTKQLKLKRRL